MVYQLRLYRWRATTGLCQALDIGPVRKKPRFELVLRGVPEESLSPSHPLVHLALSICGVNEVCAASVYISQRYDRVGAGVQMLFDSPPQRIALFNPSVAAM